MSSLADLTVVVPHHRDLGHLRRTIRALPACLERDQLCVVCDRTPTTEIDWLEKRRRLTVLRSQRPGFAAAANLGFEASRRRFVLLLNDDAEIEESELAQLLAWLREHPSVAAVQPKLLRREVDLPEERAIRFDHAGAAGGHLDRYGIPFCRGRIGPWLETDRGQYDGAQRVFWVSGACGLFRRQAVLDVGLLPVDFGSHFEEIDLAWRLVENGWELHCLPEAHAWHVGGATLPHHRPLKTYLNHRNSHLLLARNLSPRRYHRTLPIRLLVDLAASGRYLLDGHIRHARAALAGVAHGLRSAPRATHGSAPSLLYPGSIVRRQILSRGRTWNDLQLDRGWLVALETESDR